MKSRILDRPLFNKPVDETDVENVGIMQGFMDEMEAENDLEMDEDYQTQRVLDRSPTSPEILMNNLRGDMRSVDARVEELADLVGYNAAMETPPDVLALLQPVLAAQQMPQGGIPMEPQGMPPEGMGGMPPEMMGEMPPMPPEGMGEMPPMPPEMMGEMPPEAAMGGIGALPTDQGPMPPPVAMAAGGYVQSFRDGSDEEGVTPSRESSSFPAGTFSPDEIEAARQGVLARLAQGPLPVPDLSAQTETRIPLYEKLLGADKNLSQAQILFELGQRAFNYGANVDDQGRPLLGSQAARLAGAVRTLPGSMGNIMAQQGQQERAVRAAALQAAEKDVQGIRDQNVKLSESQRRLQSDIVKSAGKTSGSDYQKGSWTSGIFNTPGLMARFGAGQTTPEEDNIIDTAITQHTAPREVPYTDDAGFIRIQIFRGELPKFVLNAKEERERRESGAPAVKGRTSVRGAPAVNDVTALPSVNIPDLSFDQADTVGQTSKQEKPSSAAVKQGEPKTLWDLASSFTGPSASVKRMITSVPSLGGEFPEVTRATSFADRVVTQIVNAVRTSPRFVDKERQEIASELGLDASFMKDPMRYMNTLVGLENFLQEELTNAAQVLSPANERNTSKLQRDQAKTMQQELKEAIKAVGIPRVASLEQAKKYPTGTWILYNGELTQVTRPKQRAQNPVDVGL